MNRRPPSPFAHPPVPADSNPRLLAWQILRAWKPEGVYADEMVDHTARRHSFQIAAEVMATVKVGAAA